MRDKATTSYLVADVDGCTKKPTSNAVHVILHICTTTVLRSKFYTCSGTGTYPLLNFAQHSTNTELPEYLQPDEQGLLNWMSSMSLVVTKHTKKPRLRAVT
ncbi:unnamed protein product [Amoebophrya sp. A120]|nr:unnamed protein product [Amoebophrya sp. A120]|eukprot:GSA120T00000036001.1